MYITLAVYLRVLVMESLANHDQIRKKTYIPNVRACEGEGFPMYGGIGVSAPSLHRESTDSLIYKHAHVCGMWYKLLTSFGGRS